MKEQKYRICSLFAGAGGIDIAFEQAGCTTVWANENDRDACLTYHLNFPDVLLDRRDIRKVPASEIPEFDILAGGFPCQPFSAAGREEGFQDKRGNLFFEICRIMDSGKPQAFFLENVANLETHDHGNTFNIIREQLTSRGYYLRYLVADAQDYGFPQRRNRIYIVGFKSSEVAERFAFPEKSRPGKTIFDIIDRSRKAPEWCYLIPGTVQYEKMAQAIRDDNEMYRFSDGRFAASGGILSSRNGIAFTLLAGMGNWHDREPVIRDRWGIRKLTPYECFMLQGFPDGFSLEGIPVKSAYRQAGNTVCVPVVRQFAEKVVAALMEGSEPTTEEKLLLVGTVRNRQQLEAALSGKFYHFPARYIPENLERVSEVALYLPSWLSGEQSGIRYTGRISGKRILPRKEISELPKNSEEKYCRIEVNEWIECKKPSPVKMTGPVICERI